MKRETQAKRAKEMERVRLEKADLGKDDGLLEDLDDELGAPRGEDSDNGEVTDPV